MSDLDLGAIIKRAGHVIAESDLFVAVRRSQCDVLPLLAEVERLTAERDHYESERLAQLAKTQAAQDRVADAEAQLRASHLPDGGEWHAVDGYMTVVGFIEADKLPWRRSHDEEPTHRQRAYFMPVEPIGPGDDSTEPLGPSPVASDVARTDPAEGHAPHGPVPEAHAPSEAVDRNYCDEAP